MSIKQIWQALRPRAETEPKFNSREDWLIRSELGQRAQAEAVADWRGGRNQKFQERDAEHERHQREYPPLVQDRDEAHAELERLRPIWLAAKERDLAAETARWNAALRHDRIMSRINLELRQTAPPVLERVVSALQEQWEEVRKGSVDLAYYGSRDVSGHQKVVSNRDARVEHMEALRTAAKAVEDLKVKPIEGDELLAAIDEIINGVPGVPSAASLIPRGQVETGPPVLADDEPKAPQASWAFRYREAR